MAKSIIPKAEHVFEISWEICNKVGGIYTVVKSKASLMKETYKDFVMIGPYFEDHAKVELDEEEPPAELKRIFDELREEGILCHFGKWNIPSEPKTILVDPAGYADHKDEIKKELWERYQVESLFSAWDFEEPLIWAKAVAKLLEKLDKKNTVIHCHEWLAGSVLLHLKSWGKSIRSVFTTHATMLGRAIAGSGGQLYEQLDSMDPYQEAKRVGVLDKFTLEKACAQNASVFSTVSEVTGIEAEKILGRKPDVLVLNGLEADKFPTIEETSIKHVVCRDKIREFISYYFFPYYTFDMEQTLIYFTVCRYEYKNKGIDLFIKALAELNEELKRKKSKKNIVAMFWVPTQTYGIKTEVLENKTFYRHIADYVRSNQEDIQKKITGNLVSGKELTRSSIFSKEFLQSNKMLLLKFKRKGLPPLTTHNMDEENDPIIRAFRESGLDNREDDKVKVIMNPVYLNGADGLIDLNYYDAISGCHLGVFASYYEPWGYTPLESAALGVASVTSDLSGFGMYLKKCRTKGGIYVLKRMGVSEEESIKDLFGLFMDYAKLSHSDRVKNKIEAKKLSRSADWKEFINFYIEAHNKALED